MTETKRILIVDDEPNVRLMFRTALERPDYLLSVAEDGETALRWLESFPADLVLLDLRLPDANGLEVIRRLRARGNAVPIVFITAHGAIPTAIQAVKLGAIDFVSKPISPNELRRVVALALEGKTSPHTEFEPPRGGL